MLKVPFVYSVGDHVAYCLADYSVVTGVILARLDHFVYQVQDDLTGIVDEVPAFEILGYAS